MPPRDETENGSESKLDETAPISSQPEPPPIPEKKRVGSPDAPPVPPPKYPLPDTIATPKREFEAGSGGIEQISEEGSPGDNESLIDMYAAPREEEIFPRSSLEIPSAERSPAASKGDRFDFFRKPPSITTPHLGRTSEEEDAQPPAPDINEASMKDLLNRMGFGMGLDDPLPDQPLGTPPEEGKKGEDFGLRGDEDDEELFFGKKDNIDEEVAPGKKEDNDDELDPVTISLPGGDELNPEASKLFQEKFEDVMNNGCFKYKDNSAYKDKTVFRKEGNSYEILEPDSEVIRDFVHILVEQGFKEAKINGGTPELREKVAIALKLANVKIANEHEIPLSAQSKAAIRDTQKNVDRLKALLPPDVDWKNDAETLKKIGTLHKIAIDNPSQRNVEQQNQLKRWDKSKSRKVHFSDDDDTVSQHSSSSGSKSDDDRRDARDSTKPFTDDEVREALQTAYNLDYSPKNIRDTDVSKKCFEALRSEQFSSQKDLLEKARMVLNLNLPRRPKRTDEEILSNSDQEGDPPPRPRNRLKKQHR